MGLYHLVLALETPQRLVVGSLGRKYFPPGFYVYTRSARRGLIRRLARHLRKDKKCHWHIDVLTLVARMEEIVVDTSGTRTECQRHELVMNLPGARVIVPGFGSSDCRCSSHLAYFEKKPSLASQKLEWELLSAGTFRHQKPRRNPSQGIPSRSPSKFL